MLRVKVSTSFPHWSLERQTPSASGVWGNFQFLVDREVEECEYWVVFEGLTRTETAFCPPANTLLVTGEPPDVKSYRAEFLGQFAAVITCQRNLSHPRLIFSQQGLPWMIGVDLDHRTMTWSNFMSFAELERRTPAKTKLLSVVATKDATVPGHAARNRFLHQLKDALRDQLDVYGVGFQPIRNKWDAIAPYRYHLAIENSRIADYWTEKLADAFLGEALPIYWGCPNIADYFSERALEVVDIEASEAAVEQIREILRADLHGQRIAEIARAKHQVLYQYNFFAFVSRTLDSLSMAPDAPRVRLSLHPEDLRSGAAAEVPFIRRLGGAVARRFLRSLA